MKCVRPFINGNQAFGCGQCLPCRITRRRTWTHRLMLEALEHEGRASFVTLTYAQDQASLAPAHLQLWLKRFRKRVAPQSVRFFAVGEYGDISWRPHYHLALFGPRPCLYPVRKVGACQCPTCLDVRETWGYGHIMVLPLVRETAQYTCAYTTKKMTHRLDPRLHGRHPEFARMSNGSRGLGGLGAVALTRVASVMTRYKLDQADDVPTHLLHGNIPLPLGKYLRRKLREKLGKPLSASCSSMVENAQLLRLVRDFAYENGRSVASVFEEINGPIEAAIAAKFQSFERRVRI